MFGKWLDRSIWFKGAALPLAFALCAGSCSSTQAMTEAEAVDELIAVLGNSLPCRGYSLAWLADPPIRMEYQCAASSGEALTLGETAPLNRVRYLIDMGIARDRYTSVYRSRGTPTPPAVLAQFLSSVTALEQSNPAKYQVSPLMVYSKRLGMPTSPSTSPARERSREVPAIMIFAR